MRDFLDKVIALGREGRGFATATVVGRRCRPISAIARSCTPTGVWKASSGARARARSSADRLEAMRAGRPRLASVSPDAAASASDPEHVFVPMTCISEGAVDVYIEPNVRPRRVVVVGATPVADALARTAVALDYEVVRVVEPQEQRDLQEDAAAVGWSLATLDALGAAIAGGGPATAAVVATHGHYDEQALDAILRAGGASYVGLVASRKRGAAVTQWLERSGVRGIGSLRVPAGLDLGARTAPEVALSILAEIVRARPDQALDLPAAARDQPASSGAAAAPTVAIDPVCNMDVEIATATHTADLEGARYYFCCARCRSSFLDDPASYLARS